MKRLLFTGGAGAGNEAIFRLWKTRYDLHFADANPNAICPIIPNTRRHAIPKAHEPSFAKTVASLCQDLGVDVLVPGVDEELLHMPSVVERTPGLAVLGPDPSYVEIMLDKLRSMETLAAKGVDVPRTVTADSVAEVGFPCILKPRRGRGSRGLWTVETQAQTDAYFLLFGRDADEVVAQELLEGEEFTVMMAADQQGKLRAVVPVSVSEKRGITIRARTRHEPAVTDACLAIHERMPTRGCYNIQLILTSEGRVAPFEINPRVSTTFCLATIAGIDAVAIFSEESETGGDLLPFDGERSLQRAWCNYFDPPHEEA